MAAAALIGGATAHNHQRHAHAPFHKRGQNDTGLVCSETVETITGDFICMSPSLQALQALQPYPVQLCPRRGLITDTKDNMIGVPTPNAPPANPPTSTAYVTATTPAAPIPTPAVQTCSTPGE